MLDSLRKSMELESITGWSRHGAADALRANGWDVRKALTAMIESGELTLAELKRDKCPPGLLALAEAKAAEAAAGAAQHEADVASLAAALAAQASPGLTADAHGSAHGRAVLPFWKDAYVALHFGQVVADERDPKPRHGIFPVTFNGAGPMPGGPPAPSDAQRRAYEFLRDHEPAVGRSVLAALHRFYRDEVIARRADWFPTTKDAAEMERRLPSAPSPDDMRRLVQFDGVFVWSSSNAGVAYTGFSFACAWDIEHGVGVVTHEDRVLLVSEASDAFNEDELEDAPDGD